jgi:glycosyltransferase involved in cell wall biosynthesis
MNVALTLDCRYFRTPDGVIWSNALHAYPFLKRHLAVFEGVKVIARVRDASRPEPGWRPASGAGVKFLAVPDYLGPWQFLEKSLSVRQSIQKAVGSGDAVIMRVGSHIAGVLEPILVRRGQPYGLQVVNDPFDQFGPKSVDYLLRPLFRWHLTRQLRRQCEHAGAAAYVTERALQSRYPCGGFSTTFSDVEITAQALLTTPRSFSHDDNPRREIRLITVASLTQMYKAPDVLIQAVAEGLRVGLNLKLRIAGDGRHRASMERLAFTLGLAGRVRFLGLLPAAQLREELDASDLFLLPSRCEGLPRALIEAMARSLPCLASNVGGVPELLAPEDLVTPGDAAALFHKLVEVLRDPIRMEAMSARNLRRAADFREDLLAVRRNAFFREVRRITHCYLEGSLGRPSLRPAEATWY